MRCSKSKIPTWLFRLKHSLCWIHRLIDGRGGLHVVAGGGYVCDTCGVVNLRQKVF